MTKRVTYRVGRERLHRTEVVNLATVPYRAAAGAQRLVYARLDKAGRTLLAGSRTHRLVVTVIITVDGGASKSYRVLLT